MSFYSILQRKKQPGMSDRAFAGLLGTSQTSLLNWRAAEPKPSTIADIARHLDIAPEVLFLEYITDLETNGNSS